LLATLQVFGPFEVQTRPLRLEPGADHSESAPPQSGNGEAGPRQEAESAAEAAK
jgi:hypothetical protein